MYSVGVYACRGIPMPGVPQQWMPMVSCCHREQESVMMREMWPMMVQVSLNIQNFGNI